MKRFIVKIQKGKNHQNINNYWLSLENQSRICRFREDAEEFDSIDNAKNEIDLFLSSDFRMNYIAETQAIFIHESIDGKDNLSLTEAIKIYYK